MKILHVSTDIERDTLHGLMDEFFAIPDKSCPKGKKFKSTKKEAENYLKAHKSEARVFYSKKFTFQGNKGFLLMEAIID